MPESFKAYLTNIKQIWTGDINKVDKKDYCKLPGDFPYSKHLPETINIRLFERVSFYLFADHEFSGDL